MKNFMEKYVNGRACRLIVIAIAVALLVGGMIATSDDGEDDKAAQLPPASQE